MNNFKVSRYPKSRVATFDVGKIGNKKHHIAGLIEIDVTLAREKIRTALMSGRQISFISWFLKVLSITIEQNNFIHSINYKKQSQILFDDIDISIPIEREINGVKVPLVLLIKKINKKTIEEIKNDINEANNEQIKNEKDFTLGKGKYKSLNKLFFNLPQFIRLIIWKYLLSNPFRIKDTMGTVMFTTVGYAGKFSGWILSKSLHNLCIALGSITKKPWIYNDKIEKREILNLTILIDHDVIDGRPAAKFTNELVKNIEKAICL